MVEGSVTKPVSQADLSDEKEGLDTWLDEKKKIYLRMGESSCKAVEYTNCIFAEK